MQGMVCAASDAPAVIMPICPPACNRTSANQKAATLSPMDPRFTRALVSLAEAWKQLVKNCQLVVRFSPCEQPRLLQGSCACITEKSALVAGLDLAHNETV